MANVSPILKSQLENTNNHDRIYRHLANHANDVKPNEPKAKLIKENFVQSSISAVKDTFQDGKNFFKAAKTGQLNDNNLGRINDLGMKAGALIIASYLAAHAKTKTDSIMKFLGGATFFASMSLWPKLFINLPARLAHGFRVDYKYLSAQGDKKDLGLDNQFQPMDIFTDEEMMEMAKKTGIDPNDEFAREKMQRKLQKTMLQNRTLWMATAGFATPLMTSAIGDIVTPLVKNGVIKHGFNKVEKIVTDTDRFDKYLENAKDYKATIYDENLKKFVPVTDKLNELLTEIETGNPDKEFYGKLSGLLSLDKAEKLFKDPDDVKTIKQFKSKDLTPVLMGIREENSFVAKDTLVEAVSKLTKPESSLDYLFGKGKETPIGLQKAKELFKKSDKSVSIRDIKKVLAENNFMSADIDKLIEGLDVDNTGFINKIKEYGANTLNPLMSRYKAYIDLYNPVAGSKMESAYTDEFITSMKNVFKKLGISSKDYDKLFYTKKENLDAKQLATRTREQQNFLREKMKQYLGTNPDYVKDFIGMDLDEISLALGEDSPREKLKALTKIIEQFVDEKNDANKAKVAVENLRNNLKNTFTDEFYLLTNGWEFDNFANNITKDNKIWAEEITMRYCETSKYQNLLHRAIGKYPKKDALIDSISSSANVKRIEQFEANKLTGITRALLGGGEDEIGLAKNLKNFTNEKRLDLSAINLKAIIAANFETRLKNNEFKGLSDEELKYLETVVYNGSIGKIADPASISSQVKSDLLEKLFNIKAYAKESVCVPELKRVIERLQSLAKNEALAKDDYLSSVSFVEIIKKRGIEAFENKTWRKIFYPMAIGLVAVTLLAQPFFGKIEKEFSKKTKREEVHNGNK